MSTSPWCLWVKNQMLKFESHEKLHLAKGTWRLWSFLLAWEWVAWSALFCCLVPVGACVLAWLRAAKSASTHRMEKTPIDQCKFFFLRFCCLVTNFWEMVSGGGKHIFILEYSVIDYWYGCAKKNPGYSRLLSCWACSMGPMGLELISLAWCGFCALSLWCVENFRNCRVRSVCLVRFYCWSF